MRAGGGAEPSRGFRVLARVVQAVVLGVVGWGLNTEKNDFPWHYHNDEPSKVAQVVEGWRNLRHPPLLVDVVAVGAAWSGAGDDRQRVVEMGREFSAWYVAAGVVLLADAAWMAGGPVAGVVTGVVLLMFGPSYEAGHYFKEDGLFLLGLAMGCHALTVLGRHPGAWAGAWWAAACLVLAASKWVGWVWAAAGWIWVWRWLGGQRVVRWWVVAGTVAGLAVLMGWRLLDWSTLVASLQEETALLWTGDYRAGMEVPHGKHLELLHRQTGGVVAGLGLVGAVLAWRRERKSAWGWGLVCALGTLVVLSGTGKYSERYLLPVSWLVMWWVVVGAAVWGRRWKGAVAGGVAACLAGGVLLGRHGEDFISRREGFATDSRKELAVWLAARDTSGWKLARESMTGMYLPGGRWQEEGFFAADLGTVEELVERGITHVLVSYDVHHRFIDGSAGEGRRDTEFGRRQRFYEELLARGEVAWSARPRDPKPLHPGLTLVDLRGLGRK